MPWLMLKMRPSWCTKVRMFNLLLLLGVVNIVLFRSYFQTQQSTKLLNYINHPSLFYNLSFNGTGNLSLSLGIWSKLKNSTSIFTKRDFVVDKPQSNRSGDVVSDVIQGPGPTLRAMQETEVEPRANQKAPWAPYNISTPCPVWPPKLVGELKTYAEAPAEEAIAQQNKGLEPGGHYHPPDCRARHRIAVIVPYRNREQHLRVLLHNLHPFLMRQQLDYFILVVELAEPTVFNRGLLLNIGAVEALGLWDVQCFILHDVDLVPENDHNLYTCPNMPRHMSVAVDKFKYKLPYKALLGGVTAIRREQFYKLNGYSNLFFGWGGEDDDLASRVKAAGLQIARYPISVAKYKMLNHGKEKGNLPNKNRFNMLKNWHSRHTIDGLNSLRYNVTKVEFRPTYTYMLVSVGKDTVLKANKGTGTL